MRGHRVAAVLAAITVASCAAPSRKLTTRIVEDPITLPKRMASASINVTAIHYEPTDTQGVLTTPGFRFGITDHLEWVDVLGLRYAFLDDRPADGRAPMPLSLALRAGLLGIGYSSAEGMIVLPTVSLDALKHVGDRWALSLSLDWTAQWVARPFGWTLRYNDALFYSARRFSFLTLSAAVTRQLERSGRAGRRLVRRSEHRLRQPLLRLEVAQRRRIRVRRRASAVVADDGRRAGGRCSRTPGHRAADDVPGRHADHHPAALGDVGVVDGPARLLLVIRRW